MSQLIIEQTKAHKTEPSMGIRHYLYALREWSVGVSIYLDGFLGVIVCWSVDDNMQESLVREPFEKALLKRKIQLGLIIYSDKGGQYLSNKMKEFVQILD